MFVGATLNRAFFVHRSAYEGGVIIFLFVLMFGQDETPAARRRKARR